MSNIFLEILKGELTILCSYSILEWLIENLKRYEYHLKGMKKINADFQFNFLGLGFRVDRPMSEHLRTQRRSNLHTLFLCFLNRNCFCSLPPSTSNNPKIA
jgi:hypothetical protein